MIVALIDNGSLEPAPHHNLRSIAAALSERTGNPVHAVSWKHSDRIPLFRAWTLTRFVRHHFEQGERDFLFVPFFISAQGAIGSALCADLEKLQRELGAFEFEFTDGLAARGALAEIVADRIRETIAAHHLQRPSVVLVDHGGPSSESARLRNEIADQVRTLAGPSIDQLAAASMEGDHPPLLADQLNTPGLAHRDVVVAMLFLAPGRHANATGDVAKISRGARARTYQTDLVGNHPSTVEVLAAALHDKLAARRARVPTEAGSHVS